MDDRGRRIVPEGARQHKTAGPYSPVMEVSAKRLVVVSGQVAVNYEGEIVGTTIEEQTGATLDNCRRQLASAGTALDDVFKVNVYLSDLSEWDRFNVVYDATMPKPHPVRTAIQAILLPGYKVEIEMWAVKPE